VLRQRQNAFDERHAAREITALGEEGRQRLRWKCHNEIGDDEPVRRLHVIEPDGTLCEAFQTKRAAGFGSTVSSTRTTAAAIKANVVVRVVIA